MDSIGLIFGVEASFDISYTVMRKFWYLQKHRYFSVELVANCGLGKFCHGKIAIVHCNVLSA